MAELQIQKINTYLLVRELLYDGAAGIEEITESLDVNQIITELNNRCSVNFQEKKAWVDWYVNDYEQATKIEKDSISVTYEILTTEKKYLDRIHPNQ
ncbi:hypothetical protein [Microbulbifer discodermiae]|uniref:hypothetical protein n=1 Tax=Microbulbifer sp. 2201CG32-9 TaxID=3232309 RepID=UPI00345B9344